MNPPLSRNAAMASGSAGVSPAVFRLWPKTISREHGDLFGMIAARQKQSARRQLLRPGRSRSPSLFKTLAGFDFEELRASAKTTSDFGAESPSPRPSPIGWERENRPPSAGVSNRFGSCERRVWLFPLPSDGRVRVRVVFLVLRLLSGTCFYTNPKNRENDKSV